jgi:transcriptional regulator with XRE-family HTH domain
MGRAARLKPKRLSAKLAQIRAAFGLSQTEMVKHLGLDDVIYRSNLGGYEIGERVPPLPVLLRYAEAAGVCLDVLANDDLDLPDKLPSSPSHTGGARLSASRGKKR